MTIPLSIDRIEQARHGRALGHKALVFASTASTNDIAWEYAVNPANHGLCVLAERQTAGRGRRGQSWVGGEGQSILCSILLIEPPMEAERLTLTAAVAVADTVRAFCGLAAMIKWPNDILVNGKKLAGILVEKRSIDNRACFVIGVGINCNQTAEAFEGLKLRTPATSLRIETGTDVDRTGLVCALLESIEQTIEAGIEDNCQSSTANRQFQDSVIDRWMQLSMLLGRHITVECDNQLYSGFCRGVDPTEGLMIQLDTGTVRAFCAQRTSIVRWDV